MSAYLIGAALAITALAVGYGLMAWRKGLDAESCSCGHGWLLHDPEAVPALCMACGDADRCEGDVNEP